MLSHTFFIVFIIAFSMTWSNVLFQGLQFIAETKESVEKPVENAKKNDLDTFPGEKARTLKIHRSYPGGFSLTRDILGSGI
jgi:hypothetical protein